MIAPQRRRPRDLQIAQIAGAAQEILELLQPGIGGEPVEGWTDRARAGGGSNPPPVAPHPLIGRKAENDGPGSLIGPEPRAEELGHAWVIGRGFHHRDDRWIDAGHCDQPAMPPIHVMTVALGRN